MRIFTLYQKVALKNFAKRIIERRYSFSLKFLKTPHHYYIIRRHKPWAGFFANYLFVATHIEYAISKGYIPVVDMENFATLYNEDHLVDGIANAWEYYFSQPHQVTLDDAYHSGNYILSDTSNYLKRLPYREGYGLFEINEDKLKRFNREICHLIPLKPSIQAKLDQECEVFQGVSKILGVHVRGTDKRKYVVDHHISALANVYLDKTEEILNLYHVDKIFLCSDEEETVSLFREKFGNLVYVNNAFRAKDNDTEGVHLRKTNVRENHKYLLGYEVLRDCYMLSKCNYIIFSHSNVTNVALIWNNNKYEHKCFVEG